MRTSSESVFDRYADEYEEWFERNKFAYLSELELVRSVTPSGGRGLEVGVGTGRFAAPLNVGFGVDPSWNMLKVASGLGLRVVLAVGERLPFKDEVFDYILIVVTICFVDDPDRMIEESRRVMRDGGVIVIGIVDRDSWLGEIYLDKKSRSRFYSEAEFYSVTEVVELLRSKNFGDIDVYQTIFDLPGAISDVQRWREGYGEGGFVVICGRKPVSARGANTFTGGGTSR